MIPARIFTVGRYFYPIGNTPAVCLTHSLPPDQNAHLLLLGCGDARNVLFTVYADLSAAKKRRLDFTCCDIEPEIIARNIILFTLLIDDQQNRNLQKIWNIYYHLQVDQDCLDLLQEQAIRLMKISTTPDRWKKGKYSKILRFVDSYTLSQVNKLWHFYSRTPPDGSAYEDQQDILYQGLQKATQIQSQTVGDHSMLGACRSTAPVSVIAHTDLAASYRRYWKYGVADPNQEANGPDKKPNPMFGTPNAMLTPHYATDPVLDFHLATGYTPLSSSSPLKPNEGEDGSPNNACYRAAFVEFSAYAKAFRRAIPRLTIRFVASNALAFCHTLQHMNNTGESTAHWYRNPRTYVPLDLDSSDFRPRSDHSAPRSFDAIDTSNLADHVGCLNLLAAAGPLLSPKPTSTLSTESLIRCEGNLDHYFKNLLLGDLATVALLLGLTPIQYWTGTTATSVWDERQLDLVLRNVSGVNVSQSRYILQWKSTRYPSQGIHLREDQTIPLRFEKSELVSLLYHMYLQMVEDEPSPVLATSHEEPATGPSLFYTTASLVAILGLIHKSDLVDWSTFINELCLLITRHYSLESMSSCISPQEMFMYLHLCGLPLPMDYEPAAYRLVDETSCPLQNWKIVPSTLCITIVVPREALALVKQAKPMDGSPIVHVVLNGPQTNGDLVFADIQLGFGKLNFTGIRNSESCTSSVQQDGELWTDIAPMIVSVIVPSSIIRQDRSMSTRVTLALKHTRSMNTTGPEISICQFSLKDSNVLITKYRPNMTGHPSISGYSVSSRPQPKEFSMFHFIDSKIVTRFQVSLSKESKVQSITVYVDIHAGPLQLKLRSGTTASVSQDTPFQASIRLDDDKQTLIEQVQLPCPFTMIGSVTLAKQEEPCVKFMAPVGPRWELSGRPDNLYWIGLYQERPSVYNPHYISLDRLPILDIGESVNVEWLVTHLSDMWSATERAFREGLMSTNPRANFKNSLLSMFLKFTEVQAFSLSNSKNEDIFALILPAKLRLDLPNQTVVLDTAVIPLSKSTTLNMMATLAAVTSAKIMVIEVDEQGLLLWKHALPVMVERCRTWKHKRSCEYTRTGKIPLCLKDGERYICSCGKGTFPERFWSRNDGEAAEVWRRLSKHAIRAAISPCFSVPFVERQYNLPLSEPGPSSSVSADNGSTQATGQGSQVRSCAMCGKQGIGAGGLWRCGNCKVTAYCSRECQREHWRGGHKRMCPLLRHSGGSG